MEIVQWSARQISPLHKPPSRFGAS
jgi:hypothetical protein